MAAPWWKRKHPRPFSTTSIIGMFFWVAGSTRLFVADSGTVRFLGFVAAALGIYIYGIGLWWHTRQGRVDAGRSDVRDQ